MKILFFKNIQDAASKPFMDQETTIFAVHNLIRYGGVNHER